MPERQHADETRLVEQAKKGDAGAFGELYEFYAPLVFRFLFTHLDERQDAEDLTEEVFLRVWEALPGFRLRGIPFGGYLFRVARNALYDHYRRHRRQGPPVELHPDWADDTQPDPAESVPANIEHRAIQALLVQLREDYRMVVSLRFLVGLSTEETAAAMGRSTGAVRVLQHRALCTLRQLLQQQDHHEQ
jgi:RNA polymerase sigma-70 factor (ECF subfamily)